MHCYQNLKKLKCDTCGRDQPIQRIFEYFKSHNNYIHPGLRDERKEDGHTVAFFPRVAEDNSVGAETDENETVGKEKSSNNSSSSLSYILCICVLTTLLY